MPATTRATWAQQNAPLTPDITPKGPPKGPYIPTEQELRSQRSPYFQDLASPGPTTPSSSNTSTTTSISINVANDTISRFTAFHPRLLRLKDEMENLNTETEALTLAITSSNDQYSKRQYMKKHDKLMTQIEVMLEGLQLLMVEIESGKDV